VVWVASDVAFSLKFKWAIFLVDFLQVNLENLISAMHFFPVRNLQNFVVTILLTQKGPKIFLFCIQGDDCADLIINQQRDFRPRFSDAAILHGELSCFWE